ncbi:MAG: hypothetical protein IKW87_02455 [Ruminococcus sp.]|nr:hypothetical protein [Ruminococcus sp.]
MNMKKALASAMSAVCVLGAGILPSAPAAMAADPADHYVSLEPMSHYVKAGDIIVIKVKVSNYSDNGFGGMQVKVDQTAGDKLTLNAVASYNDLTGNADTGEAAVIFNENDSDYVVEYQYKIPDNAAVGTSYAFRLNDAFTFACDPDGNEVALSGLGSETYITVDDKGQKDVAFAASPATIVAEPGQEFSVDITSHGADLNAVSGFQFKIKMPEGIECLGLAKNTTDEGADLVFNKDTLELATAQQKGAPIGLKENEVVATVKFKVPDNFAEGDYSYSVNEAYISDENGTISTPVTSTSLKLSVGKDTPSGGKLGDANLDGAVDAKDASLVLVEYALLSTDKPETFTAQQKKNGDVNFDGKIDSKDASRILSYYSYLSTGGSDIMEEWVKTH